MVQRGLCLPDTEMARERVACRRCVYSACADHGASARNGPTEHAHVCHAVHDVVAATANVDDADVDEAHVGQLLLSLASCQTAFICAS